MRIWILAALLGMVSTGARADTIDDFVLTGDGHTITFSLPAIYQVANPGGHPFTPTVLGSTTATVDGVGGNPLSTSFYMFPNRDGGDLLFNPTVDGIAGLYLFGAQVVQYTADSTSYNYVIGFTPSTFNLVEGYGYPSTVPAMTPFTLTITPEVSAVPEPDGWVLAGTGMVLVFGCLFANRGGRLRRTRG